MKIIKTAVMAEDIATYYKIIRQGKVVAEKREKGLITIWLACADYQPVSICDLFEI